MCTSSGNQRFGVVTKTRLRDAAQLVHEPPLPLTPAGDVLDDRVREAEVELAVGERQVTPVGAHRAHLREGGGEPVELGVPDGR